MIRKNRLPVSSVLWILILLASSCISRPSYVLGESDFEDVLYDLHKAHYLDVDNKNEKDRGAEQYALMQSILEKHGVSEATWDSSMVYYTRNADELSDIYNNLMTKLSYEADAMGAGFSEIMDSTDIWQGEQHLLLTSNILSSSYQWEIPTDTLLEAGEKLTFKFLGLFLNSNAPRRASVVLAIRLGNDSVITRNNIISQTGNYSMEVSDMPGLGIKSVAGLFMIHKPILSTSGSYENPDASQILSITNISLIHEPTIKKADQKEEEKAATDKADSLSELQNRPIHREIRKPQIGTKLPVKTQNDLPIGSQRRI